MESNTLAEVPDFSAFPLVKVPAGTQLFYQGDACQHYYIVTEGQARVVTRSANGREVVLYRIEPGSICILSTSCLLSGEVYPAEAHADTDLSARVLTPADFDRLLKDDEGFRHFVYAGFAGRIQALVMTIQRVVLEPVEERLARHLLIQPNGVLSSTHQQIADELGTAREVVSRHLKRLEKNGAVRLGRSQVEVLDRSLLHALI